MKDLEVRWIIESGVLSYTDNLIKYLKEKDIYYKETNYQEIVTHNYDDKYGYLGDDEVATVFVGSLRLAKEMDFYPIVPGAICTLNNFKCTNYYPSWNPYLLNNDWTITMETILQRQDSSDSYFFRPDEGDKNFTGGVYCINQIQELKLLPNQILIRASEKCIGDEYRFLIIDRQIVAFTNYPNVFSENKSSIVLPYLERVLKDTNLLIPDRAFTIDVGFNLDVNKLGVIGLNSFSCANLYGMDMNKVVPVINELAKDMYHQAYIDW